MIGLGWGIAGCGACIRISGSGGIMLREGAETTLGGWENEVVIGVGKVGSGCDGIMDCGFAGN